jgi:hypothetical protein
VKKSGGRLRARGPVGASQPGPGAAEAFGRKQRSTSATSEALSSDLRLVHPPTGAGPSGDLQALLGMHLYYHNGGRRREAPHRLLGPDDLSIPNP